MARQLKKKILVADPSKELLSALKKSKQAEKFQIETALTGEECLKKLHRFHPDLLIVDLMLPGAHGIEILNVTKKSESLKKAGVILTSYHGMVQNYQSAVKLGASYFLEKPFSKETFFELVHRFFAGDLYPAPFPNKKPPLPKIAQTANPTKISSYLKLWGTRGSNPVAGPEYVRFGGNTPCLEIRHGNHLVIIDAGSGIRELGHILHDYPHKELNLLLSHTHWDHLLGFPFFYPIYEPEREINIWSPVGFEKNTKELFADMLAYAYFPVGLSDIQSKVAFKELRDSQTLQFGSIRISTHYAFHPGATLCFKIEVAGKKIGYVTDNEFLLGCHLPVHQIEKKASLLTPYTSFLHFLKDCDILIHEAQYTSKEYLSHVGWGHSSVNNIVFLVKTLGLKKWITTHHDPRHNDEYLLQKHQEQISLMEKAGHDCFIQMGYDGMMIPLDDC